MQGNKIIKIVMVVLGIACGVGATLTAKTLKGGPDSNGSSHSAISIFIEK
jgi:hypothetical protein